VESQIFLPCWRCGRPATAEHHEPFRSHGGTDEDRVPLCRKCHRDRHDGKFRIETDEQMVRCFSPDGELLSVRPIFPAYALRNLGDDGEVDFAKLAKLLAGLGDDHLAYFWSVCNRRAAQAFIAQGIVAHILFDRCDRGEGWYEHAARILECSPRTVYSRYQAWTYLRERPDPVSEVESIGWELTAALGKAALDGADVEQIADAVVPLVEAGEISRTEAARRVRQHQADEPAPPKCEETGFHVCRYCGETIAAED